MRIVVIGGTGLIGRALVELLLGSGQDAVAASPSTGVDSATGAGLQAALTDAAVVVDVSRPSSLEPAAALEFFQTSSRNLARAERRAGVGHHVVLSIVGADRMPDIGWMRAKAVQERLAVSSGIPYTIVRSTQFFEFLPRLADEADDGESIRLSPVLLQPIAAADVVAALARIAVGPPLNAVVELAGPQPLRLADAAARVLEADRDRRSVIEDAAVGYLGGAVTDTSLTPGNDPRITRQRYGRIGFEQWLARREAAAGSSPE